MREFKKVFFIFFFIFFFGLVSALPIVEIDVKTVFYEGDLVSFNYSFVSSQDEVIEYIPNIICLGGYESLFDINSLNLVAGEPFVGEYVYGVVDENIKNGRCLAAISILEPYPLDIEKSFEISSFLDFSFDLIFDKKVFLKGEEVILDYDSSVENLSLSSVLIYPGGKEKEIILPISVSFTKTGTYELKVEVSKDGYNSLEVKEQFAVIAEKQEIQQASFFSESESIEEKEELIFEGYGGKYSWIYWFVFGFLLVVIGLVVWILIKHGKK